MVVIRLSRGGAKKRPFYHVVISEKSSPRDGRWLERIGYFNPIAAGKEIKLDINLERARYWISTGAQPSDTVRRLIKMYEKQAQETTTQ
jgi:small subunit ribosomal protein S16